MVLPNSKASISASNNDDEGHETFISEIIGFIGAGNMAQAMISGFISKNIIDSSQVMVSAPSTKNTSKLVPLGVKTTTDNQLILKKCTLIFLAVKPHLLLEVLSQLDPVPCNRSPLFVSIAAGVSLAKIEQVLQSFIPEPRVIRVMPNTPCMVLEGCCAYSLGAHSLPKDWAVVNKMLSSISICEVVPESQLDAVCGLAGSGPAYIYTAIEAMADGAVKMGLPRNIALNFAAQTVRGAATMVLETGRHPGQLKDEVCSPSGTTIAALHVLEKNAFRNSLISAVEASTLRSRELGQQ